MKAIFNRLPSKRVRCIATVGVFDGVHLGHRFILKKVKQTAKKKGLASLVITFDIPPRQFLAKKKLTAHCRPKKAFLGALTDINDKAALISALGIDYLWFLKTKESLLRLSAQDFISYIQRYFKIEKLIVGSDFRFGHRGGGDLKGLKSLSSKHEFGLSIIRKKVKNKKIVSSSLIRQFIRQGQLKEAEQFLGRSFSLKGKVVKGKGLGSRLGFPTANIKIDDYIIPTRGVYAAYTVLEKKIYLAAVNVGLRPTCLCRSAHARGGVFSRAPGLVIEAHIINLKKDIFGKTIKIFFLEKTREEKIFSSLETLKKAIDKDITDLTSKYSVSRLSYPQPLVV